MTAESEPSGDLDVGDGPIVLFDGVCNLCNGVVQFVIPRDPQGTIRFAPLQSAVGRRLRDRCGLPTDEADAMVVVEGDDWYAKSDAALRIATHLGGPYALLGALRVVPRPLRDAAYDFVADHRYAWFGRREQCMVPSDDVRDRFLE